MSAPSSPLRQEQLAYPPTSASYPQIIAPFGDEEGHRAALRLFLGTPSKRSIVLDTIWDDTLATWRRLLGEEEGPQELLQEELSLSGVDLDPQVTSLERRGDSMRLPIMLLLSALHVSEQLDPAVSGSQPQFQSRIGSLWGCDAARSPDAQLERFLDYCRIDVSSRRNILFAPAALTELFSARAKTLHDELDLVWHAPGSCAELLSKLFFDESGLATNHIFFYENDHDLLEILISFAECWKRAHNVLHMERASRELKPGTLLGERYEIARKIGSGGFAIVYEAHDLKMPRQVAIKVIDLERNIEEKSRESYMRRFEREGRLAVSVRHPCVVEVFDIGVTSQAIPYIVMELLEGWDLEVQMRRSGPMEPKRLLPLFIQALEGLGCAHEKNIVHKDLKPSNIFLKHPGKRHEQLCILDFGVARRVGTGTARLTQTDSAFGTPHYMAPEYSTSQIATPALDIYQMGLILVELLMGEPVVTHPEPVAAMFQHVRGDLHIPQALLDSPLGPLLQTALHTNHLMRYQEGFEFADALRALNPEEIPLLSTDSLRVSLATVKAPHRVAPSSDRNTPMIGLSTTSPPARTTPLEPPQPPLAAEPISPFASTVPIDDVHRQLDSKRHDLQPKRPERASPPAQTTKPITEELVVVEDYSSRTKLRFFTALSVVLLIALIAAGLYIRKDEKIIAQQQADATRKDKDQIVTPYDRELAKLREQAASLPALLEAGRIDELITRVEEMDRSQARLTPEEVREVHLIMERARKERVHRRLIDDALDLGAGRKHEEALAMLATLPSDSVFWGHPDTRVIVDRAKVSLLPLAQRMRSEGNYTRAKEILEELLLFDPRNTELSYLLMDIIEEAAARPQQPSFGAPVEANLSPGAGLRPIPLEAIEALHQRRRIDLSSIQDRALNILKTASAEESADAPPKTLAVPSDDTGEDQPKKQGQALDIQELTPDDDDEP